MAVKFTSARLTVAPRPAARIWRCTDGLIRIWTIALALVMREGANM
jgi:hypothetical protein